MLPGGYSCHFMCCVDLYSDVYVVNAWMDDSRECVNAYALKHMSKDMHAANTVLRDLHAPSALR